MKKRRPIRAWLGEARPVDPAELLGPRGLVNEVLTEADTESPADASAGELADASEGTSEQARQDAFHRSLMTDARLARIESVVAARLQSVTVVLDRLLDPHNIAAVLRTSEGLGLLAAHVIPNEDGDAGAHRRVTQDADKWLDVYAHRSGAEAATALKAQGYLVLAGHLTPDARLLSELPADRPVALLFGNEHEGPSAQTLAACDGAFKIPMGGFTQSFNVSVAAAISLHSQVQARRRHLGAAGDLAEGQKQLLRSRYWKLGAKLARRVSGPPKQRS
ncbi:MAG: RNA methyltransferase [Deltaproteobacteria bacterium]|nr:RNA methyltransferase [Deltaproteobacteria bacterium]